LEAPSPLPLLVEALMEFDQPLECDAFLSLNPESYLFKKKKKLRSLSKYEKIKCLNLISIYFKEKRTDNIWV
jgi:hypothetical protein